MMPPSSLIPQSSVAYLSKARGSDAYGTYSTGVELGSFGSPVPNGLSVHDDGTRWLRCRRAFLFGSLPCRAPDMRCMLVRQLLRHHTCTRQLQCMLAAWEEAKVALREHGRGQWRDRTMAHMPRAGAGFSFVKTPGMHAAELAAEAAQEPMCALLARLS